MSTNYYAHTPDTPTGDEGLHIGQFTTTSEFLFRAHPALGLDTAAAWHQYLSRPDVQIVAEYGIVETLDEMWPAATRRVNPITGAMKRPRWIDPNPNPNRWRDPAGYAFANYEFF